MRRNLVIIPKTHVPVLFTVAIVSMSSGDAVSNSEHMPAG